MAKGKFNEGQIIEFIYIKDVYIEEEFMVFEDKENERYLLPAQYYKFYELQMNRPVKCLITRVDCAGKVSFEPAHPFYVIGGTYDFDFVGMQVTEETEYNPLTGKSNVIKDYEIIVADRDGNQHRVFPKNWQKKKNFKTDFIKCRVNKIIKGHFQLTNLEDSRPFVKKIINGLKSRISND
jgi:hypothetical protein